MRDIFPLKAMGNESLSLGFCKITNFVPTEKQISLLFASRKLRLSYFWLFFGGYREVLQGILAIKRPSGLLLIRAKQKLYPGSWHIEPFSYLCTQKSQKRSHSSMDRTKVS